MRVIVTLMVIDQVRMEGTLEDDDITRKEVEDCQIEMIVKVEGIKEEEGPLMVEGPLIMEDPLMMEDPQEMEGCQEDLEDKDHQVQQDLLGWFIQ